MFRRYCLFLLALVCMLGLSCAPEARAAKVWKLGHTLPKGTPEDKAIQDFASRVDELSGGAIKIKVFPAMQLGDWTVMQQRVSMGGLEMATQPASSQADKRISFLYFPYLFKNVEMLRKNFAKDAPFRKDVDALFLGQNIYPIAYVPLFFGGVATKEMPREWDVPGAPKGVKLRVPNDPAFALHAETMGYQPTPIPMSDTFTALQTGIVDGVLGFGAVGVYGNYRDLVKYYIPLNDFIQLWPVMINLQLWQGLSEEQKAILTKAAEELEARRYADFAAIAADYVAKLQGAGVKVVDVSPAVIDAFAAAAREKCWPVLAEKIDAEWINKALKAIVE